MNESAAMQPPPEGRIDERVTARMIPVAVHVTDSDGRPVTGLQKEDFRVFDNDQAQNIGFFSWENLGSTQNVPMAVETLRRIPSMEVSPQGYRTFLLLLGRGGVVDSFNATDDIRRFVQESLFPQDRIAVMAYNRATAFTTDHESILQVLERYKSLRGKVEAYYWKLAQGNGLANVYGAGLPTEIQSYVDQIFGGESSAIRLKNPVGGDTAQRSIGASAPDVSTVLSAPPDNLPDAASRTRIEPDPFDLLTLNALTDLSFEAFVANARMTEMDVQSLYTAVNYMRYLNGDKFLLFFSDQGLFLPRLEAEQSLAAMANDARVAIHTFQTGGMAGEMTITVNSSRVKGKFVPQTVALQRDYMHALSSLRQLADLTGGRWSIHSDIGKALGRLDAATRSYYLLGCDPGSIPWDGRYRRIRVEVNRPGVDLAYRRGYYANPMPSPFDAEGFLAYSRISAAAGLARKIDDVRWKSDLERTQDDKGRTINRMVLRIAPDSLSWQRKNGEYLGRLYISILFCDEEGGNSGSTWNRLEMSLNEGEYQSALKEGIRVSVRIPGNLKQPSTKAIVYDFVGDRVGSQATGWFAQRR